MIPKLLLPSTSNLGYIWIQVSFELNGRSDIIVTNIIVTNGHVADIFAYSTFRWRFHRIPYFSLQGLLCSQLQTSNEKSRNKTR